MRIAIKWTAMTVVVSLIVYLFHGIILMDMDFMMRPTVPSILRSLFMIIGVLFLLAYSLHIIIQDYEKLTKKQATTGLAWRIALLYFLALMVVDVLLGFILGHSFQIISVDPIEMLLSIGFRQVIFLIISMYLLGKWRVFEKAGLKGWTSFVPIYNEYQKTVIGKKEGWWVIMLFLPFVNLIFSILITNGVSKAFGKSGGFTLGLLCLPFMFYPMLGFGKDSLKPHKGLQLHSKDED